MKNFTVSKTIHSPWPKHRYAIMKNDILGSSYKLSLVFIGKKRATTLNKTYRNKTYSPNILSFPLSKSQGEIYIMPAITKKESSKFNMSLHNYVGYLFIHGLLHLKGYRHGDTMEKVEKRYISKYALK